MFQVKIQKLQVGSNKVFFEIPTAAQLVKKSPTYYETKIIRKLSATGRCADRVNPALLRYDY